jgi:hypothetical protein
MSFSDINDAGTRFVKGHTPKNVFVFGAGISVPAGLPPANVLLKRAILWNATHGLNTKLIEDFCEYFYPGLVRSRGEIPDVEDMLGMMDAAQEYEGVRGGGRGYRWRTGFVSDARKQLTRLVSEYLWSFQTDATFENTTHIRNIVRNHRSHTVFVTFNYDLLLETALTHEGIEFSYAIDKANNTRNVIIKPHGSINWSVPSEHARFKRWQETECVSFLNRIYVFDDIFPTFLGTHINPSYIMIAPTPHKQIENEFLKRQWTSFSSSIHSARNIFIVGYSLPSADRLARIVLRRGGPQHNSSKRITVVDPGDLEDHYRKNISPRINYVQDYCENYFAS